MTRVRAKRLMMRGALLAAALLAAGAAETLADSPYAIRDPKVPKNISPAARARLQRGIVIKNQQEKRKVMLEQVKAEKAAANNQKGAPNAKTK